MPTLYPITLSATPDAWRMFSLRKTDSEFKVFSDAVFTRDQYTCQFCGFQTTQYQEVVNLDHNYRHNKLINMVTSCCFCAQCFFLETVGRDDYGGGTLIYLPDMSQGDLNGFCHVIFCAMFNATNYRTDAQNIYRNLKLRSQVVEKKIGEGMSDPALLGRMLIDAPEKQRLEITENVLTPLRLLPSYTKFSRQIEEWAKNALKELAVTEE